MKDKPFFSLIMLDYSMPEMDGPEFATRVRQLLKNANLEEPFIVCCTAYTEQGFVEEAHRAGMNTFLSKPVTEPQVQSLIKKHNLQLY